MVFSGPSCPASRLEAASLGDHCWLYSLEGAPPTRCSAILLGPAESTKNSRRHPAPPPACPCQFCPGRSFSERCSAPAPSAAAPGRRGLPAPAWPSPPRSPWPLPTSGSWTKTRSPSSPVPDHSAVQATAPRVGQKSNRALDQRQRQSPQPSASTVTFSVELHHSVDGVASRSAPRRPPRFPESAEWPDPCHRLPCRGGASMPVDGMQF
mmetsp:Transcript_5286/g.12187  ORF Transcript_5286/g.12187 Transcript_5286/m.12187 type:complete len:209 (+) Transcript_5286:595-1221(+)